MSYGEEMLVDEGKQIASLAARQGVSVRWEEWGAMCHCFGMVLVGSEISKKFFKNWAGFCREVVGVRNAANGASNGTIHEKLGSEGVQTKGTFFEAKTLKERDIDVNDVAVLTDEEVERRMRMNMEKRHLVPEDATKVMPKL